MQPENLQRFIRIEKNEFSRLIDEFGHDDTPTVYIDSNPLVRNLFWDRLRALLAIVKAPQSGRVLDFGGGNGVLLPTLARRYQDVTCVDLRAEIAHQVVSLHELSNVHVHQADLLDLDLPPSGYDTIVASDVLEHVEDLRPLLREFMRILRVNGELLVSLPTENAFYKLGRRIFGYTKPHDHYHDADEVEAVIRKSLTPSDRKGYPIRWAPLSIFLIARFINSGEGTTKSETATTAR